LEIKKDINFIALYGTTNYIIYLKIKSFDTDKLNKLTLFPIKVRSIHVTIHNIN